MSDKVKVNNNSIGFCGLLTVLFVGLKLAEIGAVATWSWWWVLSPLWLPIVVILGVLLVIAAVYVIKELVS